MNHGYRSPLALLALVALTSPSLAPAQADARIVVEEGKSFGLNSKKETSRVVLRIVDKVVEVPLKPDLDAAGVSKLIEEALTKAKIIFLRVDPRTIQVATSSTSTKGVAYGTDDGGVRVTSSTARQPTATPTTKSAGQAFRCPRNGPVTRTITMELTLVREVAGKRIEQKGSVDLFPADSGEVSTKKIVDGLRKLGAVVNEVVWLSLFEPSVEAPFVNIDRTTLGEPVVGLSFRPDLHDVGLMDRIERVAAEIPRFGFADYGVGFPAGLAATPWIEGVGTIAPNGQIVTVSHMIAGNAACIRVLGLDPEGIHLGGPVLLVKPLVLLVFASQPDGNLELRLPVPNDPGLIGVDVLLQDFAVLGPNRLASTPALAALIGR